VNRIAEQISAEAQAAGRPAPRRPKQSPARLFVNVTPAAATPARLRRDHWTEERIIDGLVRAFDALPPEHATLTERHLRQLATGNPDIPTYSVSQHWAHAHETSYPTLRDKAVRRRTRRGASPDRQRQPGFDPGNEKRQARS
jgi:hypothetical protein